VLLAALLFPISFNAYQDLLYRRDLKAEAERHYKAGERALGAGDLHRAVAAFQRVEALRPAYRRAQRRLIRARAELLARESMRLTQGQARYLAHEMELALEEKPSDREFYLIALGSLALLLNDEEKARECYKKALIVKPDMAIAHFCLGQLEMRKGSMVGAVPHLKKAVASKPDYWEAHQLLGLAFKRQKMWTRAIEELRRALEGHPSGGNPTLHFELGDALLQVGKDQEASERLAAALSLDPNLKGVHEKLGFAYSKLGKYKEAINQLTLSFQKTGNLGSLFHLGVLYQTLRNHRQAATIFHEVIGKAPDTAAAYYRLGVSLLHLGDLNGCRAAAARLQNFARNNPSLKPQVQHLKQLLAEAAKPSPEKKPSPEEKKPSPGEKKSSPEEKKSSPEEKAKSAEKKP
jgi:tetratricopeptide (TPR) repeat protein